MDIFEKLEESSRKKTIPSKYIEILSCFFHSYDKALTSHGMDSSSLQGLFLKFLELAKKQFLSPFTFSPYHQRITQPFDYYSFGIELIRPLVNLKDSKILGKEQINKMETQIEKGENVILLANHQTEPDPQILSVLLEKTHSTFAENIVFVAGDRVTSDPLAITFSMGRNLLCIYSKKYINIPPELKSKKQSHNKRSIKIMKQMLERGGNCFFVAPSGGRDRLNEKNEIEIAPFDPQSLEMFLLIAKLIKTPTHFYPLALSTYHIMPPPQNIETELGEKRIVRRTGSSISFGEEIDFEKISDMAENKRQQRQQRARHVWNLVKQDYINLTQSF